MSLIKSLSAIEPDSVVLIDSSILVYGFTGVAGSALALSDEAFKLLSRCKLGSVVGVLTHQVLASFAKELAAITLSNAGKSPEAAIERAIHDGYVEKIKFFDPFPRLETILRSSLRLLPPQNTDFVSAFDMARRATVKLEAALSVACFQRCYGPQCLVASANTNYDSFQEPALIVFKPTDVAAVAGQ
jgi:hypothetical protein